jgi:hypothetical protein
MAAPPAPPPDIIGGHEEYEVEQILDSRVHKNKLQYLVKFKYYDNPEWLPYTDLTNTFRHNPLLCSLLLLCFHNDVK